MKCCLFILLGVFLCTEVTAKPNLSGLAFASADKSSERWQITVEEDTLNQVDSRGRKQGWWVKNHPNGKKAFEAPTPK